MSIPKIERCRIITPARPPARISRGSGMPGPSRVALESRTDHSTNRAADSPSDQAIASRISQTSAYLVRSSRASVIAIKMTRDCHRAHAGAGQMASKAPKIAAAIASQKIHSSAVSSENGQFSFPFNQRRTETSHGPTRSPHANVAAWPIA